MSFVLISFMKSTDTSARAKEEDTCAILPTKTAVIDGITAKGMLSVNDLAKIRKLVSEETGSRIISFNYSIDCDNCDVIARHVNSDTFTKEDLQYITTMTSRQVLSFDCIVGLDKNGKLITYKPFLFYIR